MNNITLNDVLLYEDGLLFWKERSVDMFSNNSCVDAQKRCDNFNFRWAGKHALHTVGNHGYRHGNLFCKRVLAHRVIWEMFNGPFSGQIDHIDHDRLNNTICNLRTVSHSDNQKNKKLKVSNPFGYTGVYRNRSGKWYAKITVNYKQVFLGTYENIDDAINARLLAERKYGFHKNHGI